MATETPHCPAAGWKLATGLFTPAGAMRVTPVGFEHVGAAAEPWATAQHNAQVRAQLGGPRCGERGFSMDTSMGMLFLHVSWSNDPLWVVWMGLCCLGKDCSRGGASRQLPCPRSCSASGQKFSSKIILELPCNGLGWMRSARMLREARGAEQGREVGMSLKNRLGKMIFFSSKV